VYIITDNQFKALQAIAEGYSASGWHNLDMSFVIVENPRYIRPSDDPNLIIDLNEVKKTKFEPATMEPYNV